MNALTPGLENYLEAIWRITINKDIARVKDIEKMLKVKAPSIVESVKNLADKNLVQYEKYGYIKLTEEGIKIAKKIYKRHKMLSKFFNEVIGIDLKTATEDACKIEHYLSEKTINYLLKFIEFIETYPEGEPIWLSSFHYYVENGELPEYCKKRRGEMKKNV